MTRRPLYTALTNTVRDSICTIGNFQGLYDFIQENKIYRGVSKYTWLSKALAVVAIIGGIGFIKFIFSYWQREEVASQMSLASFGSAFTGFVSEGYDLFVIGGLKYVILVLMEVVIFHFTRRTLEIKTGQEFDTSLKAFINAQVRMLKVVFFSYGMEIFVTIVAGVPLGMLGLEFLKPATAFIIQCFFLGFAVIDNYNEAYHMTIKQSFRYTQRYAAVSLLVGLVVYVLMLAPLVGTVLGPLIGAVVAAITMYELHEIDQDMQWVFQETAERKQRKAAKKAAKRAKSA